MSFFFLLVSLEGREQSRPFFWNGMWSQVIYPRKRFTCPPNPKLSRKLPVPRSPPNVADAKPSALKGASRQMYKSMSEQQLDEFASTKRKAKPRLCRG